MDHYIDDLFGEGPQVQIPQLPVIKQLSSRLNDLSISSACAKIAWSRHGVIACVTPDGLGVNTYVLIRNRRTAEWRLSSPLAVLIHPIRSPTRIQHVTWSYFGNELAVIDSSGRIDIFTTPGVLGRFNSTRSGEMKGDPDTELNGIVATTWLPLAAFAKKTAGLWSATKNGSTWAYVHEKLSHKTGPFNVLEKQNSFLALTRMGILRCLYQNKNGDWYDCSVHLDSPVQDLNYIITHAAFAPGDG
jgi:mediator of RNA polymerase II transcription subunit 16